MHSLLDLDYCRKAAMPLSLLFKHPSYKRSEGHRLSSFTSNETEKKSNLLTVFGVKYRYIISSLIQIKQAVQALLYADG
jgi:hypothetical protein